jgi:hypothetical protein
MFGIDSLQRAQEATEVDLCRAAHDARAMNRWAELSNPGEPGLNRSRALNTVCHRRTQHMSRAGPASILQPSDLSLGRARTTVGSARRRARCSECCQKVPNSRIRSRIGRRRRREHQARQRLPAAHPACEVYLAGLAAPCLLHRDAACYFARGPELKVNTMSTNDAQAA